MFAARTSWSLEPNRLSRLAARHRAGADFLDLTVANPTRAGFTYDRPAILAALGQAAALRYDPDPRGLAAARAAVAGYYRDRGQSVSADRIFLTPGTSEAYAHLFRLLCDPGDRVLVPAPGYPLFDLLADLNDIRIGYYPLLYDQGWQLDPAELARALESPAGDARVRALLVVHPNNPTGSYCKPGEWQYLQSLAAARGLAVVVDEVFFDYALDAAGPELDYAAAPALTCVLNGLSKTAALPQMKLGWIALHGPDPLVRAAAARLEIIQDVYLSVDTPIQCAAAALLATRAGVQSQIRRRLRANLAALDRALAAPAHAAAGVGRLHVEAGWNAVLRLPRLHTDEEWAELLVERAHVLTHPGHFYALAREAHLVVSLLTPAAGFAAAIERLLHRVAAESANAGRRVKR